MISLFAILEIIGFGIIFVTLVLLLCLVRRLKCCIGSLREHCDERIDGIRQSVEQMNADSEESDDGRAEAKRKALEAERRFTEGVANILSFSYGTAGKKGE